MATRHARLAGGENWIALDAGGTMTDAVVVDSTGDFLVGKFLKLSEAAGLAHAVIEGGDAIVAFEPEQL